MTGPAHSDTHNIRFGTTFLTLFGLGALPLPAHGLAPDSRKKENTGECNAGRHLTDRPIVGVVLQRPQRVVSVEDKSDAGAGGDRGKVDPFVGRSDRLDSASS